MGAGFCGLASSELPDNWISTVNFSGALFVYDGNLGRGGISTEVCVVCIFCSGGVVCVSCENCIICTVCVACEMVVGSSLAGNRRSEGEIGDESGEGGRDEEGRPRGRGGAPKEAERGSTFSLEFSIGIKLLVETVIEDSVVSAVDVVAEVGGSFSLEFSIGGKLLVETVIED